MSTYDDILEEYRRRKNGESAPQATAQEQQPAQQQSNGAAYDSVLQEYQRRLRGESQPAPQGTETQPIHAPMPQPVQTAAPEQEMQAPVQPSARQILSWPRYGRGNIDLFNRNTGLRDEQGKLMTVNSMSFGEDGKEILVPTVVNQNGKWVKLSDDDAIEWYRKTGENLGKFNSVEDANKYAEWLHNQQDALYGSRSDTPNHPVPMQNQGDRLALVQDDSLQQQVQTPQKSFASDPFGFLFNQSKQVQQQAEEAKQPGDPTAEAGRGKTLPGGQRMETIDPGRLTQKANQKMTGEIGEDEMWRFRAWRAATGGNEDGEQSIKGTASRAFSGSSTDDEPATGREIYRWRSYELNNYRASVRDQLSDYSDRIGTLETEIQDIERFVADDPSAAQSWKPTIDQKRAEIDQLERERSRIFDEITVLEQREKDAFARLSPYDREAISQTWMDRVVNTTIGTVQKGAASYQNAIASLGAYAGENIASYVGIGFGLLQDLQDIYSRTSFDGGRISIAPSEDPSHIPFENAIKGYGQRYAFREAYARDVFDPIDKLNAKGVANIDLAHDDVGFLGGLALDVYSGALDVLFDTVLNAIVPGSFMASMLARSYGASSMEARQKGADPDAAILYGLKGAAIEYATEKIAGLGHFHGEKGLIDGWLESGIEKFVSRGGNELFARMLIGFGSEGMEEALSDVFNYGADYCLSLMPGGKFDFVDPSFDFGDMLYDFLVGGLLGMAGSSVDYSAKNSQSSRSAQNTETANKARTIEVFRESGKLFLNLEIACDILSCAESGDAGRAARLVWRNQEYRKVYELMFGKELPSDKRSLNAQVQQDLEALRSEMVAESSEQEESAGGQAGESVKPYTAVDALTGVDPRAQSQEAAPTQNATEKLLPSKPALKNDVKTRSQKRVARLLNQVQTQEQWETALREIVDDPALAQAYYDLTEREASEDLDDLTARRQEPAGRDLAQGGIPAPANAENAQEAPPREFNSENRAGESRELAIGSVLDAPASRNSNFESDKAVEAKADAREIVGKLRDSIPDISSMESVSSVSGTEFAKGSTNLVEQVASFFKQIGNKVFRRGLGDVVLDRRSVKNDIAHGIGRAKAATFAAVPDVIAKGKIIDHHANWKGRGYDSYVIAAPIDYNGARSYVAAVVLRDSDNRFYLHEVVSEEGGLIRTKNGASASIKTGVAARSGTTGEAKASNTRVADQPVAVKRNSSGLPSADSNGIIRHNKGGTDNGNREETERSFGTSRDRGKASQDPTQVYTLGVEPGASKEGGRSVQNEGVAKDGEGTERGTRRELIGTPGKKLSKAAKTEQTYAIHNAEFNIALFNGHVLGVDALPAKTRKAVERFVRDNPNVPLIVFEGDSVPGSPAYTYAQGAPGSAVICVDPEYLSSVCPGITLQMALNHESGHVYIYGAEGNSVRLHERVKSFVRGDAALVNMLVKAYQIHATIYHATNIEDVFNMREDAAAAFSEMSQDGFTEKETMWNEVFADLYAGVDRAFPEASIRGSEAQQQFTRLVNFVRSVFNSELIPAYNAIVEGKANPQTGELTDASRAEDSRAAEEEDYQEENEQTPPEPSQEEEIDPAEMNKAALELRFGEERMASLQKSGERMKELVGESFLKDGGVANEGAEGIQDFVATYTDMLDGNATPKDVCDAYLDLRRKSSGVAQNYFFDEELEDLFDNLSKDYDRFAASEEHEKRLREEYADRFERASRILSHRFAYAKEKLQARVALQEAFQLSKGSKVGKNIIASLEDAKKRQELRPSTVFRYLAGLDPKGGEALYAIADEIERSLSNRINTYETAEDYLSELSSMKGFKDFMNGKKTVKNVLPGVPGKEISATHTLSLLKTLETSGVFEDLLHGADITLNLPGEKTVTFDPIGPEIRDVYVKAKNSTAAKKAAYKAREEVKRLIKDLHTVIDADPLLKTAYDNSFGVFGYLKRAVNKSSRANWGVDFANQGKNYYPVSAIVGSSGPRLLNAPSYGMNENRRLIERKRAGHLQINSFTDVMESYIQDMSRWSAYQGLSDLLDLYSRQSDTLPSLTDLTKTKFGDKSGAKWNDWLEDYVKDLNKTREGSKYPILSRIRSNLALSSLSLNVGVALKQTASAFNFAGVVDYDIVLSRFATGLLKTKGMYKNNPLIQAVGEYTRFLDSRESENHAFGDSTEYQKDTWISKFVKWSHIQGLITRMDYRTVANGMLACADQVKRNHKGDANFKTDSDAFYKEVAALFEKAVMNTQPIYDREFRAEYLRTSNEIIRGTAMFRTQPTQNYNNFVESSGELTAAKERLKAARENAKSSGSKQAQKALDEAKADVREARKKAYGTRGGLISSALVLAAINIGTSFLRHKLRKYRDDDDELDWEEILAQGGYDALSSLLGTEWILGRLAPFAIDVITGMDKNLPDSQLDYGLEDAGLSVVNDALTAIKSFSAGPSPNTGKALALSLASVFGIPMSNAYRILNTVTMYAGDFTGVNYDHSDDFVSVWNTWWKADAAQRGRISMRRALSMLENGTLPTQAEAILSSIGRDNDTLNAARDELKQQYILGAIDEKTYREILQKYCGVIGRSVLDDLVESGNAKRRFNEAESRALALDEDAAEAAKERLGDLNSTNDPTFQYRMDTILDLGLSVEHTDAYVEHYSSKAYYSNYSVLREAGLSPSRANDMIQNFDLNSDGKFSQDELWTQYQLSPSIERYIELLWNEHGWTGKNTKTWDAYKAHQEGK